MKRILILLMLLYSFTSNAQNITYDAIISVDWSDYPFSVVEMLMDNGLKYLGKLPVDDLLDPKEKNRESLYTLIYGYENIHNITVSAAVAVDEMCVNNISTYWPLVKLRFMYETKNIFQTFSEKIKSECKKHDSGFYVGPNSLTFVIDKELLDGKPSYIILIYHMTEEMLEEIENKADKLFNLLHKLLEK